MKVVIDTNVFLISLPRRSIYRTIFDACLSNKILLIVTTSIFFEYLEIFEQRSSKEVARYIDDSLTSAKNVIIPSIYYYWDIVTEGADDNKFIDAYLAEGADYLVTNDAHF